MFTAMDRIRVRLLDVLRDQLATIRPRSSGSPPRCNQILDLELAIMLETYREDLRDQAPQRRAAGHHRPVRRQHRPRAAQPAGRVESSLYLAAPAPRRRGGRRPAGRQAPRPHRRRGSARQQDDPRPARSGPQPPAAPAADRLRELVESARRGARCCPAGVTVEVAMPAGSHRRHRPRSGPAGPGQPVHQRRPGDARPAGTSGSSGEAPAPTGARAPGARRRSRHPGRGPASRLRGAVHDQGQGQRPRAGALPPDHGGARRHHRARAEPDGAAPASCSSRRPPAHRRAGMSGLVLIVDDDEALAENLAEIVGTLGRRRRRSRAIARRALALAGRARLRRRADRRPAPRRRRHVAARAAARPLSVHCSSVMVTGNASVEGAIAAVRGDAFAYVLKPVSPPDLLDTTRRALDQAALYRERERLRDELERSEATPPRAGRVGAGVRARARRGGPDHDLEPRARTRHRAIARAEMLGTDGRRARRHGRASASICRSRRAASARFAGSRAEVQGRDGRDRPSTRSASTSPTKTRCCAGCCAPSGWPPSARMAAGLAHEVRNPLNSASLQLTVLERRLDRGDERDRPRCPSRASSRARSNRLDRLVRDFLAFAQPAARSIPSRSTSRELLAGGRRAHRAGSGGRPSRDRRRRRRRATPPRAGRRRAAASGAAQPHAQRHRGDGRARRPAALAARAAGAEVEIDVEDDGPGFAEELPVFDAFFTTKSQGTGLGLASSTASSPTTAARSAFESRPGRTCFTLALPSRAGQRASPLIGSRRALTYVPTEPGMSRGPSRWPFLPTTIRSAPRSLRLTADHVRRVAHPMARSASVACSSVARSASSIGRAPHLRLVPACRRRRRPRSVSVRMWLDDVHQVSLRVNARATVAGEGCRAPRAFAAVDADQDVVICRPRRR